MEGGHPIALEGMQIGGDPFGPPPGYPPGAPLMMPPTGAMSGFEPPPPPPGFGAPPPAPPPPGPSAAANVEAGRRTLTGFLISFQEDPIGKFWPIFQGRNVIGRAETGQAVDVPIGHGTTSTHHAAVDSDGNRFTLSDLGSTNGTFHNEEAIGFQGRRELRDGDKIRFGGFSVGVFIVAGRF
jgi:pSer/pThr/pTyr-binding forkhead associated (FHA) protein